MDTTVYERLVQAGIRFVSYRPRSEKEIQTFLEKKLTRWKAVGGTVVKKVIDRLRELGYVDDAKFAAWWVEQRKTFKPKGMRLILRELRAKGMSREALDETVAGQSSDEADSARKAMQKKLALWQKLAAPERKKKLYGFLGSRGFSGETIRRLIDEADSGEVQS